MPLQMAVKGPLDDDPRMQRLKASMGLNNPALSSPAMIGMAAGSGGGSASVLLPYLAAMLLRTQAGDTSPSAAAGMRGSTRSPDPGEGMSGGGGASMSLGPPTPPSPDVSEPQSRDIDSGTSIAYKVREGDNLWTIAQKFTGSPNNYQSIARMNGISNPDMIMPGQVIRIPMKSSLGL